MTLREQANEVLDVIGQSTLTDAEYIMFSNPTPTDATAFYTSIANILNRRGGEGVAIEKLNAYALLNGVNLQAKKDSFNNIFLGAPL